MKNLITVLLLILSIGVFAQNGDIIDKVVGVVGEEIILKSEVETQLLQFIQSGAPTTIKTRCNLYEDIMYQKLLLHQSKLDSIEVGEDQIESEMQRRLAYFISQIGSEKKLEEFYNKSILEIKAEFHDVIRDQILVQMMEQKIMDGIELTPSEVKDYFKNIPKDSLPYINSEVELAQIVIKPKISDREKEIAKIKMEGYRKDILAGLSKFKVIATLYSSDPGSAAQGGSLGYMLLDNFVPEFADAARKLKVGDLSEVIETEYGYHIMEVLNRRGEEYEIRHILLSPKVNPYDLVKAKNQLDSITILIDEIDTLNFEIAATLFSDDEETKQNGGRLINYMTGASKFDMAQLGQMDATLSFTIDKMEEGDISKPIATQLPDGSQAYRLVKIMSRTDPHIVNLDDDYQRIKEAAKVQKQAEKLANWITKKAVKTYIKIDNSFSTCEFENNWGIAQP
jgi:peptidyl-prolyl cis-trans isomerase SurA